MLAVAGIETPRRSSRPGPSPSRDLVAAASCPSPVIARQLANPFLVPDFSAAEPTGPWPADWPTGSSSSPSSSPSSTAVARPACRCPAPRGPHAPGVALMPHQKQLVRRRGSGHRTFLLADEPGLGKTAQALIAAQAADAYPLLCVVPNVVKANWAHEVSLWTPNRTVTVIHGDGEQVDGFADIVVVNYEVLDRHVGWLGDHGFRGMVVDEAHFIKNKSSQRSQHVLELSAAPPGPGRAAAADGADRHAADQRHRGLPRDLAVPRLDRRPEAARRADEQARGHRPDAGRAGLLPQRPPLGHRDGHRAPRKKIDVAADIPARRVADLPVELEGEGPLHPRGRARARPPPRLPVRRRARGAHVRPASSTASTTTSYAASPSGSARTWRPPRTARTSSP